MGMMATGWEDKIWDNSSAYIHRQLREIWCTASEFDQKTFLKSVAPCAATMAMDDNAAAGSKVLPGQWL